MQSHRQERAALAQEPAPSASPASAPAEPVAAQCRFPGVAWWQCNVEHARMVLANPSEWPRYQVRMLYDAAAIAAARREERERCAERLEAMKDPWITTVAASAALRCGPMRREVTDRSLEIE